MASVEGRAETLASVHSTLRESFIASDIAESPQIPRSLARVTLAAVLNNERKSPPNSNVVRTLLDIIRAEETLANHPNQHHQFTGSKTTWKSLKERLKLRRNSSNPTCSIHNHNDWMPTTSAPQPDATAPQPQLQVLSQNSLRDSLQMADSSGAEAFEEDGQRRRSIRLSDALAAEREERSRRMSRELEATEEGSSRGANGGEPAQEEEEPIRMSLMDLLEESERQSGIQGPIYSFDDIDYDELEGVEERDVNEEEEKGVAGVSEVSCCVCMVRHKGAAFIPCGHTFCRMCSRELWVQRGHCPLCNSFILEVLDIF